MSGPIAAGGPDDRTAPAASEPDTGCPDDGRQELWDQAVDTLTAAARLRAPGADRGGRAAHDDTRPVDFAGFLADVLAAVAANVGGTQRLIAGRPGSWEADLVRRLVAGTVGHDDEHLLEYRTEPVVVPLNVLDLAYEVDGFPSIDAAVGRLDDRYRALRDGEYDVDAYEADLSRTMDAYASVYERYAAAFVAALAEATDGRTGLRAPVQIVAVHDPRDPDVATVNGAPAPPDAAGTEVRNPSEYDDQDPLVARLWHATFRAVPMPAASTEDT